MKGYNGVAILSRRPIELHDAARRTGAPRATAGTSRCWCDAKGGPVELHNFYVPGRRRHPRPRRRTRNTATSWISSPRPATGSPRGPGWRASVLVGDLNIAPLEHDVWSHKQLLDVVSHTPPETAGLTAWLNTGFVDAVRHFVPADQKLYTWWSYRNRDWRASDRGRRLDHVWVTPDLQGALTRQIVLKDARDWPQRLGPRAGLRGAVQIEVGVARWPARVTYPTERLPDVAITGSVRRWRICRSGQMIPSNRSACSAG